MLETQTISTETQSICLSYVSGLVVGCSLWVTRPSVTSTKFSMRKGSCDSYESIIKVWIHEVGSIALVTGEMRFCVWREQFHPMHLFVRRFYLCVQTYKKISEHAQRLPESGAVRCEDSEISRGQAPLLPAVNHPWEWYWAFRSNSQLLHGQQLKEPPMLLSVLYVIVVSQRRFIMGWC